MKRTALHAAVFLRAFPEIAENFTDFAVTNSNLNN